MLETIDRWIGLLYVNMKKVVNDSGDFIQGFKKMLVKELDAVIKLMFDLGIKLCIMFIALDIVLYLTGMEYWKIHPVSKVLALIGIVAFKFNIIGKIKSIRRNK